MKCFIVGNGKSLKAEDLDLLHGHASFGLNRIHMIYDQTDWRPTYLCYFDTVENECGWEKDLIFHASQSYRSFIWSSLAPELEQGRVHFDIWNPRVTYVSTCIVHANLDSENHMAPNSWHSPEICRYGGAGNVAIQIASQKFNEIYLLGFDLDWEPRENIYAYDPNHFSQDYGVWDEYSPRKDLSDRKNDTHRHYHRTAKAECDTLGIGIFNAGRAGEMLDGIYPRVSLEKAAR